MKTISLKNKLFNCCLLMIFLLLCVFFSSFSKPIANATEGSLFIVGPDTVSVDEDNFHLTAVLKFSQIYTARNIIWSFEINNQSQTAISASVGAEITHSIATFPKSLYQAHTGKVGIATAIIKNLDTEIYKATWQILFIKNKLSNATISANILQQEFNDDNEYSPFVLSISPPSQTASVTWLLLSSNGKFLPQTNTGSQNTFSLTPEKAGIFSLKAKIISTAGQVQFTKTITLIVKHKQLERLQLNSSLIEASRHGLDTYLFELEELDETQHDIKNINWYRKGYSAPLQYGGSSFLFKPVAYDTYHIYARYEGDEGFHQNSNEITIPIKIDRTKEIFWFVASIVGGLTIGLIILINRNIKRDKIW